ncbi:MAG: transcription-repair coupling factor [Defluviitaleaceae bacterium]|nr:transcription-repair coupling factor [Defluviitaleaceae bacterium]
MQALAAPLLEIESYRQVLDQLKKKEVATALCTGVVDGQKCHLAWAFGLQTGRPLVVVTHSHGAARDLAADLTFFTGGALNFPVRDYLTGYVDVASKDATAGRLAVLAALLDGNAPPIVCCVEALFAPLSPRAQFEGHVIEFAAGDVVDMSVLAAKLVAAGYERADTVEGLGQFAIRGGIVDIFAPTWDSPVRMELWGDEIDSIRSIDVISQRSLDKLEGIRILPVREFLEDTQPATLFDYLPADALICFDEPSRVAQTAQMAYDEYLRFVEARLEKEQEVGSGYFDYLAVLKVSERFDRLLFSMLTHNLRDIKPTALAHFDVKSSTVFKNRLDLLEEDLRYLLGQDYAVVILAGSATRARRLAQELDDAGFVARYTEDLDSAQLDPRQILLNAGNLTKGFEYPHLKLAVISGAEFFGEDGPKRRKVRRKKKGSRIDSFTDLSVGDHVVHDNHGVGVYRGLEKIEIDGAVRDYLKIGYHGESNLYIAISQLDALQKYIGGEGHMPRLSRLGGADWQKAKAKARAAVEEVAKELVELYAKRESLRGHGYSTDTVWQAEFEETFIHEETDDQLAAVEDVKRDMESQRVMDRLVCGDVGYGKTEVAIRAAFKAVCDQKQVVYLCPTTILAQQHYNTFAQRMKDFPINIDVMSRFRSTKEQKATLEKVKKGGVDILVGTHRLLSKDVEFKDLGLIIVDEEQRFGVMHKERLKQKWQNVDVMTLTATPIPRTLHMSLAGIRDMSLLEEPPLERQPIQTYVLEYSDEIVASAIGRELNRGGQVYYLHNRVENIARTAARVAQLAPGANVAYAHGQMNETELENVMMDFIDGTIDVLVCTTIVENGLDIPNVNTIIIQDADNMGLAQLYQLRGRVGRASRSSFAYLMYRRDKVLSETAEKRLQTIREFTQFGSGFKIAMRDLEIRGAGNILGAAQHGHMDAVGYEMYCKLLDLAVKEMRGDNAVEGFETLVDIVIDAFIPDSYIRNEHQKLEMYKKISHISGDGDFMDVQEEMEDRFGTLPTSAQNLLDIALLKARANATDITGIAQKGRTITVTFKSDARVDPLKIGQLVQRSKGRMKFTLGTAPYLTLWFKEGEDFMGALANLVLELGS